MRTLRLQLPPMSGSDVSAWQRFLAGKNFYRDVLDGAYGPLSDQGTRDYQAARGLAADGVAGFETFSQALRDGFESIALPGMDAAVDCSAFASCIANAGMKFVVRYYRVSNQIHYASEAVALSAAIYKSPSSTKTLMTTSISSVQN